MHFKKGEDYVQQFEERRSWETLIPWVTLLAVAFVLFTLHANNSGWITGKATLKGFVSDGNNKLYAFTTVNLIDDNGEVAYTVEVDRDGFFEVPDAAPGIYTIQIGSANGPYEETQTLVLRRGTVEEVSIFLEEEGAFFNNEAGYVGRGTSKQQEISSGTHTRSSSDKKHRRSRKSKYPFFKSQGS